MFYYNEFVFNWKWIFFFIFMGYFFKHSIFGIYKNIVTTSHEWRWANVILAQPSSCCSSFHRHDARKPRYDFNWIYTVYLDWLHFSGKAMVLLEFVIPFWDLNSVILPTTFRMEKKCFRRTKKATLKYFFISGFC